MHELDRALYRTRKNALDTLSELPDNSISLDEITLNQCSSCNIWLKPAQLSTDLDGSPICKECETHYGL
jgi:hypothetical protein